MVAKHSARLFVSANWVIALAVFGALVAAQWKHQAIPLAFLGPLLVLTVVKARLIILDFMGLRSGRPSMAMALCAWPIFFAVAALARAAGSFWLG